MGFIDYLRNKMVSRSPLMIFLLGVISTFLGVGTAYIVFPENVGLMGLAFASLILQPFVSKLIYYEEEADYRERRISRMIFHDHSQTFKTILLLFFGIMLAYSVMYLYSKEVRVKNLFSSQLSPYCGMIADPDEKAKCEAGSGIIPSAGDAARPNNLMGGAGGKRCSAGMDCFMQYIFNNLLVMLVVLILSSAYGAGAMLFLGWNASVWGTVFAYIAVNASSATGAKTSTFLALFVRILPHTFLEASAYFLAVIAGIVITKAYVREKMSSSRFKFVIMDGLLFFFLAVMVVVIAAAWEAFLFPAI